MKQSTIERQSNEAIKKYVQEVGGDGHTILKPEYLIEMGFTKAFVKKYTVREKSGKDFKSQLFDNTGHAVPYLEGVYTLSFAYGIAENIGASQEFAHQMRGRGFQAQALITEISKVVNKEAVA